MERLERRHRMYRSPLRKAPPTVIEYQAKDLRPSAFVLAVIFVVLAIGLCAMLHTSTISCRRASEFATARCAVDRNGIRPLHADLRAESITGFDVRVVENKKHHRSAEVRLQLAPSFRPTVLALETGAFGGGLDVESTLAARDRFLRFQGSAAETTYEASFTLPPVSKVLVLLGAVLLGGLAVALLREQLQQLRPVRIVVDHERGVIVLGARTVPLAEVRDVIVEQGLIRQISNRKGEYRPGYKIAVLLASFDRVAATREWRPGSWEDHEAARQRVLEAMGRAPT